MNRPAADADAPRAIPWRWRYVRATAGTLMGTLGVQAATTLARAWARYVFNLQPPVRARMEANLREAYGADSPASQRKAIARGAFENVAAFWVETLFLRRQLTVGNWRQFVCVPQLEEWTALARCGRPLLLVTGYLGNPVVAACALSEILAPLHVLTDPASRMVLEAVWPGQLMRSGAVRRFPGLRVMDAARAETELPEALAADGRVLMLAGPARSGGGRHKVSFLGRESQQPATIARLAHRHDADIVVFACRRVAGAAFRFELSMIDTISSSSRAATAAGTTRVYLESLERAIREDPEQYLWTR